MEKKKMKDTKESVRFAWRNMLRAIRSLMFYFYYPFEYPFLRLRKIHPIRAINKYYFLDIIYWIKDIWFYAKMLMKSLINLLKTKEDEK